MVTSLDELIGGTPLVRLRCFDREIDCALLVKLEGFNPGGSVKDRTAAALIDHGERTGLLRPGGTIVEPTSGNTGIGLALLAARRGYRCVFVMLDKVSEEKVALLRAYGAEVVLCPAAVPPGHPDSYYSVANRLCAETPDAYQPNQYANLANQAAHFATTGPEIWEQTGGCVSHFVAGAGTGGTVSGAGRYLKERNPSVEVVCADPVGSIYSGSVTHSYLVDGVGEDFIPANYDASVVDRVESVSDAAAFAMCRTLIEREGLLTGGSGGMALVAALRVARAAEAEDVVVALLPDNGRGDLSKVHSEAWLVSRGFRDGGRGCRVSTILHGLRRVRSVEVRAVLPSSTVRDAIGTLRARRISRLPVATHERPSSVGDVLGSVSLATCERRTYDEAELTAPVRTVMEPGLPLVGIGQSLADVVASAEGWDWALVLDRGRPTAMLSLVDAAGALRAGKCDGAP